MRYTFAALLILTFLNSTSAQDKGGNYWDSVKVNNSYRKYLVHLPVGYVFTKNENLPLLLFFHGGGGKAKSSLLETKLGPIANKEKFIVVFPQGYKKSWADGRGTTHASRDNIDDIAFTKALIDKLSSKHHVNKQKVFAAGISNGGFMVQTLACAMPKVIKGICSVVASLPKNIEGQCKESKQVGVMIIAGTKDPFVPYNGGVVKTKDGGEILGMKASTEYWSTIKGCKTTPTKFSYPDITKDGTTVERYSYENCPGNTMVVLIKIIDGGHQYPGGFKIPTAGKRCTDIYASEVMWDFFKKL